jgi:hypothetical protein
MMDRPKRQHPRIPIATRVVALAALAAAPACKGTEPGNGSLDVRIWGGDAIEEGIPPEDFVDGWTITWDRFVVALDAVATEEEADMGRYLFDLTAVSGGAGNRVVELASPSGMTTLAYRIGPGDVAEEGNADDLAVMMEDEGWSIYVAGTAVSGVTMLEFAWGFEVETDYAECEIATEVPEGEEVRTLITIAGERLFNDTIDGDDGDLRFNLLATADVDMNLAITSDELEMIIPDDDYDAGDHDADDMWEFLEGQAARLGRIDGDGPCMAVVD